MPPGGDPVLEEQLPVGQHCGPTPSQGIWKQGGFDSQVPLFAQEGQCGVLLAESAGRRQFPGAGAGQDAHVQGVLEFQGGRRLDRATQEQLDPAAGAARRLDRATTHDVDAGQHVEGRAFPDRIA